MTDSMTGSKCSVCGYLKSPAHDMHCLQHPPKPLISVGINGPFDGDDDTHKGGHEVQITTPCGIIVVTLDGDHKLVDVTHSIPAKTVHWSPPRNA